ncbi:hypothetical protein HGRIS_001718 [Hohenbuehelia grisea]|uniref:Major facilitator superfamily (MFS) profile domain-containing protein n=1 Tax=Hohenbuehelia grisea TaxID=104357 RepID=A0ABR3JIY0_9AGAR
MPSSKVSDDSDLHALRASIEEDLDDPAVRRKIERTLLRKLDLRMSFLVVLMILNIIDRNNTPAARLRGFEKELNLSSTQYSTGSARGKRISDTKFLPISHTVSRPSFAGAVLCRFFLGAVEAAFMPGALLLLSRWYKRDELGLRSAILFCGSFVSNAFGSLLASAILDKMEGKLHQSAWRWLFFVEGAATIVIASFGIFILPDFPSARQSWLTSAEQTLAEIRVSEEVGSQSTAASSQGGHLAELADALSDWKIWWLTLLMTFAQLSFSFAIFFPTLTATLGYDRTKTLLLCAPPWIVATLAAFALTRHSDYTRERCYHSVLAFGIGMLGFLLAMSTMNVAVRYVSLFFMAFSPVGGMCIMAWAISSIHPASKRTVGLAIINAVSQLALVAGPYAWDQGWGPSYVKSFAICLAAISASVGMTVVFRHHLATLNTRAERDEQDAAHREKGVSVKGFRYML